MFAGCFDAFSYAYIGLVPYRFSSVLKGELFFSYKYSEEDVQKRTEQ
jgi:hypothetical protein